MQYIVRNFRNTIPADYIQVKYTVQRNVGSNVFTTDRQSRTACCSRYSLSESKFVCLLISSVHYTLLIIKIFTLFYKMIKL